MSTYTPEQLAEIRSILAEEQASKEASRRPRTQEEIHLELAEAVANARRDGRDMITDSEFGQFPGVDRSRIRQAINALMLEDARLIVESESWKVASEESMTLVRDAQGQIVGAEQVVDMVLGRGHLA